MLCHVTLPLVPRHPFVKAALPTSMIAYNIVHQKHNPSVFTMDPDEEVAPLELYL